MWNSFDHVDLKRASLGDAKCQGWRGPRRLSARLPCAAGQWLAAQQFAELHPSTGDFVISMPEQNWVLKSIGAMEKEAGGRSWRWEKAGTSRRSAMIPTRGFPISMTPDSTGWLRSTHDPG